MSQFAIKIENLGKKYTIGHRQQDSHLLRYAIANQIKNWKRQLFTGKNKNRNQEEFWALKDISFEVKQGDRVGIIGRNGAGKSTLLKLLSRITEPTTGRIRLRGRVASLLEVGTGFHPELTGRENIYLNGSILGMGKTEISKKFDEIVAFAEIERFLDTPVKRYSSGMYVRLAFAVAAHLEPEILVVDEVLAVGDVQFQKKCLGKMGEVSREGRTVLFVSHNMSAIESLCDRGILLDSGQIKIEGTAIEALEGYLHNTEHLARNIPLEKRSDRSGSGRAIASSLRILNDGGEETSTLQSGKDYTVEIGYFNPMGIQWQDIILSLDIFDERGTRVLLFRTNFTNENLTLKEVNGSIFCTIQNLPLANGLYRFSIFLSHADSEILDYIEDAALLAVEGGDFFKTGSAGLPSHCKILHEAHWFAR